MSVDLAALGTIILSTNPNAVVLSVWIGVGGCLWPISSSRRRAGIACLEFKYSAPISASAAEVMTFFIILAMLSTAPLFLSVLSH